MTTEDPGFATQPVQSSHPPRFSLAYSPQPHSGTSPFGDSLKSRSDCCFAVSCFRNQMPYRRHVGFLKAEEVRVILTLEENYERVRKEYAEKDAIGIPMSVRERYERELSELLQKLQELQEGRVFGSDSLKEVEVCE